MSSIEVAPLRSDLAFGARISGVNQQTLKDDAIRRQLNDVFEDRGLIVFEDVEPTGQMHLAISNVFGPLKDHPVPSVPRVDNDTMPGVIDMRYDPQTGGIVELDGKRLAQWLPWHFDHCYNNELNRAGVLRAIDIPAEGGRTGFADGVGLYHAIRQDLREKIEDKNLIYTLDLRYSKMRFGKPKTFQNVRSHPTEEQLAERARTLPRAIHPAVWTRSSGEKVLHVSPWMAVGIEGREDAEGEALLEAVCQEIVTKVQPYFHEWKCTDMLIWDNWRMLHSVSGHPPEQTRRMQRTTIKGDYGLGYFENDGKGNSLLEMTV
jgi:taurine dioxygenase